MPLDPKIAASFWTASWDKSTTKHEKQLISWVDDLFSSATHHDAEYALQLVLAIHEADTEQKFTEVFAAGPVEDLLAYQGSKVIDRVVSKAKTDSSFAHVLGGVWKNSMQDDIWEAIKEVRDTTQWADART